MAFVKRTWLARIGTGLNKFIIGEKDANDKQTLVNSPDSVTQQGDVISADNLNDLEDRIEDGFNEKQDVLTFDDVPTLNSNNPVKSSGIAGMRLTKIWENQSPLSDFSAQTISLGSDSTLDEVVIEYCPMRSVSSILYTCFKHIKTSALTASYTNFLVETYGINTDGTFQSFMRSVCFYAREGTAYIQFGSGIDNTNPSTQANSRMVPIAVYKVGDIYNS